VSTARIRYAKEFFVAFAPGLVPGSRTGHRSGTGPSPGARARCWARLAHGNQRLAKHAPGPAPSLQALLDRDACHPVIECRIFDIEDFDLVCSFDIDVLRLQYRISISKLFYFEGLLVRYWRSPTFTIERQ
jgi:hypothetical protein